MITQDLIKKIKNGMYDETLKDVYVDEKKISYERDDTKDKATPIKGIKTR